MEADPEKPRQPEVIAKPMRVEVSDGRIVMIGPGSDAVVATPEAAENLPGGCSKLFGRYGATAPQRPRPRPALGPYSRSRPVVGIPPLTDLRKVRDALPNVHFLAASRCRLSTRCGRSARFTSGSIC
jgi:hypothetical protein